MAKILLINPNKWGRGITAIWIPAHAAMLKYRGHEVRLFDATFYRHWTVDEVAYNTGNNQYQPTDYNAYIRYSDGDVRADLQALCESFEPDIIFWSALSSHIHGEGEYVNIQYGYELAAKIETPALRVTGGLQATAAPQDILAQMPKIDVLIRGESDVLLADLADRWSAGGELAELPGLAIRKPDGSVAITTPQPILRDLDVIPPYDYSIFDDQVFFRPYNGKVLRAVDYEMSRGCIYACEYCVETVIQSYYGFTEHTGSGVIRRAKRYLRNKSAERVFAELTDLHDRFGVTLIRCQDTNFLTIDRGMLTTLADTLARSNLDIRLYIETRPEGITASTIPLLQSLKVDGVGMGVELSTQAFREDKLRRFASTEKIIRAFALLREGGIKRTAYNIIGLPEQDEASILETIAFNRSLDPDNMTVAFYSPYLGTLPQVKGKEFGYFDDYEFHVDGQLRTVSKHTLVSPELLAFYKAYFNRLAREGFDNLEVYKAEFARRHAADEPRLASVQP
jgi:anaerobic magnesium-protoporphyrin IX monomethyl ester cyclase